MNNNAEKQPGGIQLAPPPQQAPTPNLWPDSIRKPKVRAPITILKEQAFLLGQRTQNIVTATVGPPRQDRDQFTYPFLLVAPALGNYTLALFWVTHSVIAVYPLWIHTELLAPPPGYEVQNEEALLDVLKTLFSHPKTIQAVESILAQSDPA